MILTFNKPFTLLTLLIIDITGATPLVRQEYIISVPIDTGKF